MIVISGEAGIGKTRLCEELEHRSVLAGCQVLVGRCVPDIKSPYHPFDDAFRGIPKDFTIASGRSTPSEPGHPSVADIKTDSGMQEGRGVDQEDCSLVMYRTLEALRAAVSRRPVVLRIDDLQWTDSASAQVLQLLARNISRLHVLILVTYRPEDLQLRDEGSVHPLIVPLRAMRMDGDCTELNLGPLDERGLRAALEGMLDEHLEDELFSLIVKETGGNPLFAVEMIRMLIERGDIRKADGEWSSSKKGGFDVPRTVQEVILRRLEKVDRSKRRLLECSSVMGERFDPHIIGTIMGMSAIQIFEMLDALERENHLVRCLDKNYHFWHEKVQRVVYESISSSRRRELHRLLGNALETHHHEPDRYCELSMHFCMAKDKDKCLRYSFLAGEYCWKRCSYPEAVPYLERALEQVKGQDDQAIREKTLEYLGDVNLEQARYSNAAALYEQVLSMSSGANKARILRKLSECWVIGRLGSDMDKAFQLIAEAEACPEIEPWELGNLYNSKANYAVWLGDFGEAEKWRARAEHQFEVFGPPERYAFELTNHAYHYLCADNYAEAKGKLVQALAIFIQNPHPKFEVQAHQLLAEVLMVQGEQQGAISELEIAITMANLTGDHLALKWTYLLRSLVDIQGGNLTSATHFLKKSFDEAGKEEAGVDFFPLAIHAHLLAVRGKAIEAESICRHILIEYGTRFSGISSPVQGVATLVLAEAMNGQGQYEESDVLFIRGMEILGHLELSSLYKALGTEWYADCLLARGQVDWAIKELNRARVIYARIGNQAHLKEIDNRLSSLGPKVV